MIEHQYNLAGSKTLKVSFENTSEFHVSFNSFSIMNFE